MNFFPWTDVIFLEYFLHIPTVPLLMVSWCLNIYCNKHTSDETFPDCLSISMEDCFSFGFIDKRAACCNVSKICHSLALPFIYDNLPYTPYTSVNIVAHWRWKSMWPKHAGALYNEYKHFIAIWQRNVCVLDCCAENLQHETWID